MHDGAAGAVHGALQAGSIATTFTASQNGIRAQRERVIELRHHLSDDPIAREFDRLADYLVDKSVWIVGGDGWAHDIGCVPDRSESRRQARSA